MDRRSWFARMRTRSVLAHVGGIGMATKAVSRDLQRNDYKNQLFAAAMKFCEKQFVRVDIQEGKQYPIKGALLGTFGRFKINVPICGNLNVGTSWEGSANSAAPAAEILGAVLQEMPKAKRQKLLYKLRQRYQLEQTLGVSELARAEADAWLKSIRGMKPSKKAGSVSFISEK